MRAFLIKMLLLAFAKVPDQQPKRIPNHAHSKNSLTFATTQFKFYNARFCILTPITVQLDQMGQVLPSGKNASSTMQRLRSILNRSIKSAKNHFARAWTMLGAGTLNKK